MYHVVDIFPKLTISFCVFLALPLLSSIRTAAAATIALAAEDRAEEAPATLTRPRRCREVPHRREGGVSRLTLPPAVHKEPEEEAA